MAHAPGRRAPGEGRRSTAPAPTPASLPEPRRRRGDPLLRGRPRTPRLRTRRSSGGRRQRQKQQRLKGAAAAATKGEPRQAKLGVGGPWPGLLPGSPRGPRQTGTRPETRGHDARVGAAALRAAASRRHRRPPKEAGPALRARERRAPPGGRGAELRRASSVALPVQGPPLAGTRHARRRPLLRLLHVLTVGRRRRRPGVVFAPAAAQGLPSLGPCEVPPVAGAVRAVVVVLAARGAGPRGGRGALRRGAGFRARGLHGRQGRGAGGPRRRLGRAALRRRRRHAGPGRRRVDEAAQPAPGAAARLLLVKVVAGADLFKERRLPGRGRRGLFELHLAAAGADRGGRRPAQGVQEEEGRRRPRGRQGRQDPAPGAAAEHGPVESRRGRRRRAVAFGFRERRRRRVPRIPRQPRRESRAPPQRAGLPPPRRPPARQGEQRRRPGNHQRPKKKKKKKRPTSRT